MGLQLLPPLVSPWSLRSSGNPAWVPLAGAGAGMMGVVNARGMINGIQEFPTPQAGRAGTKKGSRCEERSDAAIQMLPSIKAF